MQLTRELLSTTSTYINLLAEQGITDLKGLMSYYPRGHEDRAEINTVDQIRKKPNTKVTLKAQVISKKYVRLKSRTMGQCVVVDEDGVQAELSYFKTGYAFTAIQENQRYLIIGKPKITPRKIIFSHPELVEASPPSIEFPEKSGKESEKSDKVNDLIQLLLRSSVEIHKKYGNTLSEKQYQKILSIKLTDQGVNHKSEAPIIIMEGDVYIGSKYIDLLLEGILAVELKADSNHDRSKNAFTQLRKYMELEQIPVGLVINFGGSTLHSNRLNLDYQKDNNSNTETGKEIKLIEEEKISNIKIEEVSDFSEPLSDFSGKSTPTDTIQSNKTGRIYPIYSELQGISPGRFANKIRDQLGQIDTLFPEFLPHGFMEQFGLISREQMIRGLHYPEDHEHLEKARFRWYFEKLLTIQLNTQIARRHYQSNNIEVTGTPDRELVKQVSQMLPFTLTDPQKKSIKQIIDDFYTGKPMMRMMQGDVGSGKTVVAAIAAYYLIKEFGQQAIIMAPLEVLAQQHYLSISKLLLPLNVKVGLLVGSLPQSQKDKTKLMMRAGHLDLIIGTHALVQEDIDFHNLGLVVIDEQHKFGVMQRGFFHKFDHPHILQMTATPIPRSLALAAFAEFDVSIIDQLPGGRKPIITKVATSANTKKIQPRIADKLNQGQNMFVVVPLIEESENLEGVDNAFAVYEQMQELYPDHRVGLMHGKMKPKEKDEVMSDFKSGKLQILVSTTVIEVGVDVPHATIMIIKSAQRFGLAQLHQLRGRVGRSDLQSYCFLETKTKDVERLQAMEATSDGFELARLDMKLRGTGELLGTRQSGIADIPLDMISDLSRVETVQKAAARLLDHYPDLAGLESLTKNLHVGQEELLS